MDVSEHTPLYKLVAAADQSTVRLKVAGGG